MTDTQEPKRDGVALPEQRDLAARRQRLVARGRRDLSALEGRTVRFPHDRSLGTLFVRERGRAWYDQWGPLGEARGTVRVPAGKTLKLKVSPEGATDLSSLAALAPNDLRALDLSGTAVDDGGVAHLEGLTELEMLDLGDTRITDVGFVRLEKLIALEALQLTNTQVSDAGIRHLRGLAKLRWLILAGTQVTDAGWNMLERALPILPQPAHPMMLVLADPGGNLKLEDRDTCLPYLLDLEPESLVPVWWPWGEEGERWNGQDRKRHFRWLLTTFALPAKKNLTPEDVLGSLWRLIDLVQPWSRLSVFEW